ncbi:MAG: hypothetical protein ACLT4D_11710 [Blautia faecis]
MDEYDSANPACVEDRTTNILKHFMNDYYAREVSEKLVQAHRLSRNGEVLGGPPLWISKGRGKQQEAGVELEKRNNPADFLLVCV